MLWEVLIHRGEGRAFVGGGLVRVEKKTIFITRNIFMVIFNLIKNLRIPKYNIYSSTLLYTNVSDYTVLQGCDL